MCIQHTNLLPPTRASSHTYFGEQNLYLQVGKPTTQAHSRPVAVRQRGEGVDGIARVGRLQPAFRLEFARIATVLLHAAGDDGGEDHLDALGNVVAAYNGVLLQRAPVANHRTVHAVYTEHIFGNTGQAPEQKQSRICTYAKRNLPEHFTNECFQIVALVQQLHRQRRIRIGNHTHQFLVELLLFRLARGQLIQNRTHCHRYLCYAGGQNAKPHVNANALIPCQNKTRSQFNLPYQCRPESSPTP